MAMLRHCDSSLRRDAGIAMLTTRVKGGGVILFSLGIPPRRRPSLLPFDAWRTEGQVNHAALWMDSAAGGGAEPRLDGTRAERARRIKTELTRLIDMLDLDRLRWPRVAS